MRALDALWGAGTDAEWRRRLEPLADEALLTANALSDGAVRVTIELLEGGETAALVRARCSASTVKWERFWRFEAGSKGIYLEFVKALDPQFFRDRGVTRFEAVPFDEGSKEVLVTGGFEEGPGGLSLDLSRHNRMDQVCGRAGP